jgi:hypothetical protein
MALMPCRALERVQRAATAAKRAAGVLFSRLSVGCLRRDCQIVRLSCPLCWESERDVTGCKVIC